MLPKFNRIKKKKDFEMIFKNSKIFRSPLFVLRMAKNNLSLNRFGFVVSQKISKKAVIRNKVKRRLSEAIKNQMGNIRPEAQEKNGADMVLVALSGIEKKDFFEIKEEVDKALIKTGLIKCSNP